MLNIIIGNNAIGKTIALKQLKKKFQGKEVSNIGNLLLYKKLPYNKTRLDMVESRLDAEIISCDLDLLSIVDYDKVYTQGFVQILTFICKDADILLLDEPDKNLTWHESNLLVDIVSDVQHSFKDIFIVTHDECMARSYKANVITPRKVNGKIRFYKVAKEKINEIMGKI